MKNKKSGIKLKTDKLIMGQFSNTITAYVTLLKSLMHDHYQIKNDPKIKYEARTVSIINPSKLTGFEYQKKLIVTEDYDTWGDHNNSKAMEECAYYQETIFDSRKFEKAMKLLKKNHYSKKAIIDLNKNPTPSNGKVPCLTYLSFRVINGKLNMSAHMRANNAYLVTRINMDVNQAIHHEASRILSIPLGDYYHFVDSMHIYNQDIFAARNLLTKMTFSRRKNRSFKNAKR